jgi:hypothetical protein
MRSIVGRKKILKKRKRRKKKILQVPVRKVMNPESLRKCQAVLGNCRAVLGGKLN